jgi:hypothetical protein
MSVSDIDQMAFSWKKTRHFHNAAGNNQVICVQLREDLLETGEKFLGRV